jgi:hypothetical protein
MSLRACRTLPDAVSVATSRSRIGKADPAQIIIAHNAECLPR